MLDARTLSLLMLSFGSMSNKKLQKMCYYMYSWYLAIFKERVANVQFEAWVHGPVCRDIYNMYKRYGWEDIPSYIGFIPVEEEVKAFASLIWNLYGNYSADELEQMTHKEHPWQNARRNCGMYEPTDNLLADEDIYVCYHRRYLLKNGEICI